MSVNVEELSQHLGVNSVVPESVTVTEVEKVDKVTKVQLTELTVAVKISPRGTYSSAETSMTVSLQDATPELKRNVKDQLRKEVIEYTIVTADSAIAEATKVGMM